MDRKNFNTKRFRKDFYRLVSNYPEANELINVLGGNGELILFGGVIREYIDSRFNTMPRDFDIVFNKNKNDVNLDTLLKRFNYRKNRFGGYKIRLNSLEFDIWDIEDTWAFKEGKVRCLEGNYSNRLHETVFLNIDSIVYNLSTDDFYGDIYNSAMKDRTLDIVLHENPYRELNFLRTIIFKRKYNMKLSNRLAKSIVDYIYEESHYLDELYKIQLSHYNCEKVSKLILDAELNQIILEYWE